MNILDQVTVDPRAEATLTQQMKERLIWLIASGDLMPGDRLPPLRQVAEHLAVNINTVRSVYQKLEQVGLVETRQGSGTRVLSHDPTHFAQLNSTTRSDTIGVIVPSLSNPFYHSLLEGIEEVTHRERTLIFVCNTHDNPEEALRYFSQLSTKQVDGIIVASHDAFRFLPAEPGIPDPDFFCLPLVTVDWPEFPGYCVLIDSENAGYQATRHLLEHGHRRIGLITFVLDIPNVHPVNLGYQRALQEAGIEMDPNLIAHVQGFDQQAGVEGACMLLALEQPPTAIFAIADMLAIGAMSAIQHAGMQIPKDIALTSFNDITLAPLVNPPLTTVAAPAYQMGQEAMRMLQKLISGEQPLERRITLPTALVIRRSCGCQG